MGKKILAFAGSTSSNSINKKLVTYACNQLKNNEFEIIDLRDFYPLPMFSVDEEEKNGYPESIQKFKEYLDTHDAFIVSLAEHNGSYSAAYKNIFDWVSRLDSKLWQNKPVLLLSTSPGGRGGKNVMNAALNQYPHMGADIRGDFSLPFFSKNFEEGKGISDPEMDAELRGLVEKFDSAMNYSGKN